MSETISPNTTLAHYVIISKIGAGGMGEVYLAQDTNLDRKVALKILPADVAADQTRMRRFVQEARLLRRGTTQKEAPFVAAINHETLSSMQPS